LKGKRTPVPHVTCKRWRTTAPSSCRSSGKKGRSSTEKPIVWDGERGKWVSILSGKREEKFCAISEEKKGQKPYDLAAKINPNDLKLGEEDILSRLEEN